MEKKWSKPAPELVDGKFLCIATFLPLKRWWHIPGFVRMSLRIENQIKRTPGLFKYALKTNLPRKHFWTLSVWNSRQPVNAFVSAEPHRTAVKRFEMWAGSGAAFVEWESSSSEPSWAEVFEKLKNPNFYYNSRSR